MYRNRFKLDKRSSETPITTTSTAAASSSSTAESNNNPFKWSGGGGGENEEKQQITLKPVLPIVVKKKLRKQNEKVVYCTYYNRDGFCRNGSGCRFVHEKTRIRTCPEFVKTGSCTQLQPKCHLRHRPDPHTMESCLHFRRGMCHRGPACPYPHINVDDNARVCLNFQQGYCSKGAECTLKHVKKKAAKKTDELEHLRPFKSAADLEEEERAAEMERATLVNGWCSRFYGSSGGGGGTMKKMKIYPSVAAMGKMV